MERNPYSSSEDANNESSNKDKSGSPLLKLNDETNIIIQHDFFAPMWGRLYY